MATAQETIRLALRKLRRLGIDANPTSRQSENHLGDLNRFLLRLHDDTRPDYVDFSVTASGEISAADIAVRLNIEAATGLAITLSPTPQDGASFDVVTVLGSLASTPLTIDPNGRKFLTDPDPGTVSADGAYRFRADLADWKAVSTLDVGDDLPFPAEWDDYIACAFARAIRSYYGPGCALSEEDDALGRDCVRKMRARYVKPGGFRFDAAVANMGGGRRGYSLNDYLRGDFD